MSTTAVADSWNIFDQVKHGTNTDQEQREVLRLTKEKFHRETDAIAWSPDGKSIATTGVSKEVIIWDAASLSIRHQMNQGSKGRGFDNIAFSPDSQYLASGFSIVSIWKVTDGTLHMTLVAPHITPGVPQFVGIKSLRFSPDGKMLVVVYDGDTQMVIAYRTEDGRIAWSYEPKRILQPERKGSPLIRTPLVFTPDGQQVALSTTEYGSDDVNYRTLSRILVLDAKSGELLRSINDVHVKAPTALAMSPDGKWLATGTSTGWKSQTLNRKTNQVVTVDNQDPVRIWNLETGKMARELPVLSKVWYLAFSRDGKYLFGSKDQINTHLTIAVWDVATGKMVQEVKSNPAPTILATSPDGKALAAACEAGMSIYEITTGD